MIVKSQSLTLLITKFAVRLDFDSIVHYQNFASYLTSALILSCQLILSLSCGYLEREFSAKNSTRVCFNNAAVGKIRIRIRKNNVILTAVSGNVGKYDIYITYRTFIL